MKKGLAALLTLPILASCCVKNLTPVSKLSCEFPKAYEEICYDVGECENYMQNYYGKKVADKIAEGKMGKEETVVDVNLYVDYMELSKIGEVWAERTEKGFYVCEDYIFCNINQEKVGEFRQCALIPPEEEEE